MNIYNITKGQLIVLWVVGLIVVFMLWSMPQSQTSRTGGYIKPMATGQITQTAPRDLSTVINVVILGALFFYTLGWKNHNAAMPKSKRLEAAKKYLAEHTEITNNEYQKLTGVSDATATRDLDALEQQGTIEQVGKTGAHVKYRLKP